MNMYQRFISLFSKKDSEARKAIAITMLGRPIMSPRNFEAFSKEGYAKNVIANRCISLTSKSMSRLPVRLMKRQAGKKPVVVDSHPILDLLDKPNPMQGQTTFLESVMGYFLISGNTFIEGVAPTEGVPPKELWSIRPDRISIVPGFSGMPSAYIYKVGSEKVVYPVDMMGRSRLMHMLTFNPTDDWWGLSPLQVAALDIDQLNESGMWNLALLQNSARPSGAFSVETRDGKPANLTENQRAALRQELTDTHIGANNAGKFMLLEGGLKWQELSLSPKDMDFLKTKNVSQKDVGLVYGVPSQLLGLKDSQTFANYEQANLSFHRDTVIPLGNLFLGELNRWLVPAYGDESLFLMVNDDEVAALAPMRNEKWNQVQNSEWLTVDEKREMTGKPPYIAGSKNPAEIILVSSNVIPLEIAVEQFEEPEEIPDDDIKPPEEEDQDDDSKLDNEINKLMLKGMDFDEAIHEAKINLQKVPENKNKIIYACIDNKFFNIASETAKRRFWIRQMRKRARLESPFRRELKEFFKRQGAVIAAEMENVEPALLEMVTARVLDEMTPKLEKLYFNHVKRIMNSFGDDVLNIGKCIDVDMEMKQPESRFLSFVNQFISLHTAEQVKHVNNVTKKKIVNAVRKAFLPPEDSDVVGFDASLVDVSKAIQDEVKSFSRARANAIARTEVHTAANVGGREAAKSLQVVGLEKEWLPTLDTRTRDGRSSSGKPSGANHRIMKNVRVPLDEKFKVPSADGIDLMDGPGDNTAPVDQRVNCRCVTIYVAPQE